MNGSCFKKRQKQLGEKGDGHQSNLYLNISAIVAGLKYARLDDNAY